MCLRKERENEDVGRTAAAVGWIMVGAGDKALIGGRKWKRDWWRPVSGEAFAAASPRIKDPVAACGKEFGLPIE